MSRIDISVVLTLHREAKYLPRTLLSLSEAAMFGHQAGLALECIAVFDRTDTATRNAFVNTPLQGVVAVRTIEVDNGCVSQSRNAGCAAALGKYTFILDGDDLISYSIFPKMYADAERGGLNVLLTPKFLFGFGESFFSVEYFDSCDINAGDMIVQHLYNSRLFGSSAIFREIQYESVAHNSGYAFEDWHFNCQAMARGYQFRTTDLTASFYRQRADSRNHEAKAITTRQIPPSVLFEPAVFLRAFPNAMLRPAPLQIIPRGGDVLSDPAYVDLLFHANAIEPSLFLGNFQWRCIGHFNNLTDGTVAGAYRTVCEIIGTSQFDEVFFLSDEHPIPEVVRERMRSLANRRPRRAVAAWFNGTAAAPDCMDEMERHISVLNFGHLFPQLDLVTRDILCLKLLQASGGTAALHFVTGSFAHRFIARFSAILHRWRLTYYRSPDGLVHDLDETFRASGTFQFISDYIDSLDEIVPLDPDSATFDQRRLRYGAQRYSGVSSALIDDLGIASGERREGMKGT